MDRKCIPRRPTPDQSLDFNRRQTSNRQTRVPTRRPPCKAPRGRHVDNAIATRPRARRCARRTLCPRPGEGTSTAEAVQRACTPTMSLRVRTHASLGRLRRGKRMSGAENPRRLWEDAIRAISPIMDAISALQRPSWRPGLCWTTASGVLRVGACPARPNGGQQRHCAPRTHEQRRRTTMPLHDGTGCRRGSGPEGTESDWDGSAALFGSSSTAAVCLCTAGTSVSARVERLRPWPVLSGAMACAERSTFSDVVDFANWRACDASLCAAVQERREASEPVCWGAENPRE
ncbi:hypothetical protein VTO73DRAFT_7943 [Trametes versicolor]